MHDLITLPSPAKPRPSRIILLLQSMVGPLFRRVGKALRQEGFTVFKVNFSGGDRLFWAGCPGGIDFTGTSAEWPDFLARLILQKRITDVILFGDCRPLHRPAIALCRNLQIPVHVFDEGYIRPDWITFERGGVNGHSQLPRDPDYYLSAAQFLHPLQPHRPIPSSFRRRASEAFFYAIASFFMRWRFPHWQTHRPWTPIHEAMGWVMRFARQNAAAKRACAILKRLKDHREPYMLFPLQLDSDAQIRFHSPFPNMVAALREVMKSFAAHATPALRLVVKQHPLDNGLTDWRRLVAKMAAGFGIADRVDYIETGDIALIVKAASGLVTVNSTTGTLALASNIPVITLGHAVYNMQGITFQGRLDDFWNAPGQPDQTVFTAFRRVLIDRCLVAGGFFSEPALQLTVKNIVERFKSYHDIDPEFHSEPRHFATMQPTSLPLVNAR